MNTCVLYWVNDSSSTTGHIWWQTIKLFEQFHPLGMPTIIIFTLPLASTPTCIKAPHYYMTLPHDFVDLKLGLQLALQLDWPCLKKSICLTYGIKNSALLSKRDFYVAKSLHLHGPVMPCLVPGQAHWKHVLHTNWWCGVVVFKLPVQSHIGRDATDLFFLFWELLVCQPSLKLVLWLRF